MTISIINYPSRELKCPSCGKKLLFSWLGGLNESSFFIYDKYNNIYISSFLFKKLTEKLDCGDNEADIESFLGFFLQGKVNNPMDYNLWNNVSCPHCRYVFPYYFRGNLEARINDSKPVLMDGCIIHSETRVYKVRCFPVLP